MSEWKEEPIREHDQNGHLTASGYKWVELNPSARFPIVLFALIPAGLGAIITFIMAARGDNSALLFFAICAGAFVFGVRALKRVGHRHRAIVFQSDGFISAPFGLWRRPEVKMFAGPGYGVASIESRNESIYANIEMYLTNGENVRLAYGLWPNDGLRIATQLNIALQELRMSAAMAPVSAAPAYPGAPAASASAASGPQAAQPARARRVID